MSEENKNLDIDAIETREWLDALATVLREDGSERAKFLLEQLQKEATKAGLNFAAGCKTPYVNTIAPHEEAHYPDDNDAGERLAAIIRWNAAAMVLRATKKKPELGGHIATYASAATLYDIGFNYFFHAPTAEHGGDLLYIQGHSSPGIYARAFLEGRLTEEQLDHFREEVEVDGLSSYPHPWLMKNFWQFPTVSMGLGPLQAIYQARFLKYLENRGLIKTG
ncbi:MAG: pyruvate dehydrogenase (acetyl-transferring), homodimeric type, partial [Proteobacteria bacterium]|nr:pyruvate dehydrogenase (acetyl-transferring), homodimeric type [Pseudomonadota bacterium]